MEVAKNTTTTTATTNNNKNNNDRDWDGSVVKLSRE